MLKLFRIFQGCFTVQLSRFFIISNFCMLSQVPVLVNYFFSLTNGEGGIWTLAPLLTTCTLSRGVPSASWVLLQTDHQLLFSWRREWDSNPRALADKRFSRPPRYDHFDISPFAFCFSALQKARIILSSTFSFVNNFFYFFRLFIFRLISGLG